MYEMLLKKNKQKKTGCFINEKRRKVGFLKNNISVLGII